MEEGMPPWGRGMAFLAGSIIVTAVLVLLMDPIDELFVNLGFATRRSEAMIPFVAGSLILASLVFFRRSVNVQRQSLIEAGGSAGWWKLGSVTLVVGMVIVSFNLMIFVLLFFVGG